MSTLSKTNQMKISNTWFTGLLIVLWEMKVCSAQALFFFFLQDGEMFGILVKLQLKDWTGNYVYAL